MVNVNEIMKQQTFILWILLFVSSTICAQQLVRVGEGYSNTSVNTTVFRNNSLVTQGNTQYIAYYAPDGYLMLGKRTLGDPNGLCTVPNIREMWKTHTTSSA